MLQFLDCVHQLIQQFPFAFQFNTKFLQDIAYYAHTCQFGTFLANSYQVPRKTMLRFADLFSLGIGASQIT